MDLYINEIFYSIEGETTKAGCPAIFIRLSGCNLNCAYCDTGYARSNGFKMSIKKILENLIAYESFDHITITGGEPLLQRNSIILMKKLINASYSVQLETNGSISIENVPDGVRKIVDVKTPSSGEAESFIVENLGNLHKPDELKFVISNIDDYHYSKEFIEKHTIDKDVVVNFSPVDKKMTISELAELILVDRLHVRLNIQLHKVIWQVSEPKHH